MSDHREPLSTDPLAGLRQRIDQLDRDLLAQLAQRMQAVAGIGRLKREDRATPLRDDRRERELFEVWAREAATLGMSPYFAGRVLREILNWSRREQERQLEGPEQPALRPRLRVGYQGVPACYSDLTLTKIFATRDSAGLERIGFRDFRSVVDALEAGELSHALLPIENTIAGSINEVYDLLAERSISIVGEEAWPVEHCLLGLPGTRLEDLRAVRSHPVALQQCQRFLEGLVGVRTESWHDTAGAAQSIPVEAARHVGAIASEEAAQHYGLEVLRREISDQRENLTRFVLLARGPERLDPRQPAKTSLLLAVNHRPGALLECLKVLGDRGLNLTKLESRPVPRSPWEYLFYVDFEGSTDEGRVQDALDELRSHTSRLKVLGCYPRRVGEPELDLAALAGGVSAAPSSNGAANGAPAVTPAPAAKVCAVPKSTGPAKLVAQRPDGRRTTVRVGDVEVGAEAFVMMAGPCSVESRTQVHEAAAIVRAGGARVLRGGAFKPRTHPYAFQGLGFEGLDLLVEAGRAYELPVVTEVLRPEDVEPIARRAHMLQVGARNMQNFALLKALGTTDRPVLLKRGMSATIEELLCAAEYVLAGGNHRVILCERGIRTFETSTRSTLDVSAVPVLRERTHLPILVDPSHAAGVRHLVQPLALAAAAAGADGLIVEVHPDPAVALSDKEQALDAQDFERLMAALRPVVRALGRTL